MAYRWTQTDLDSYRALVNAGQSAAMSKQLVQVAPKRPNKYGNVKVTDEAGVVHDSKKEYRRWCELKLRESAGEISGLRRQVVFDLIVGCVLVCKYIADAEYVEVATGERIVEDTKSEPTRKKADYRIKRKLLKAIYGIDVREV